MTTLRPVRGTRDLLADDAWRARHVTETGRIVADRYGYDEVATPVFEATEVFSRTLGETSDIVSKEMYTFQDKGGGSLTLRPEGTAGIARALISGGLSQHLPLKFFYAGPMFRYERPQKGRLRQFHQIGAELLGVAEPIGDVEVIALGSAVLEALDVRQSTTLELNTLGNASSRAAYRAELVEYFGDHESRLSDDSCRRLTQNPLRILDSKDEKDRAIVAGAPDLDDSLDNESREFFDAVQSGLQDLGIAFSRNPRLVRGLDYYCHTAFEFTTDALGAQGAVLAGGRYDGLVAAMGGPQTPGVGWASGIERLSMLVETVPRRRAPVAIVPIGERAETAGMRMADRLRKAGFKIEIAYRGRVRQRMKRANDIGASAAILIGDDELEENSATIRDLQSGEQSSVPLNELETFLRKYG